MILGAIRTAVAKHVYLPAVDYRREIPFFGRIAEARRNEKRSPAQLAELQTDKLRALLRHARETSPYYRKTLSESVDKLRSVDELAVLPFVTKNDVFESRELLKSVRPRGQLFAGSTSGSTGMASRFHFDSEHAAWVEASQWRGRGWWGLERGDPQLVLWSRPVEGSPWVELKTWSKYRLRNCLQFDTFKEMDDAKLAVILHAIEREKPKLFYGYGSSMGKLADFLDRKGITLASSARPRLVEYTADHMFEAEQRTGARVFGAKVCGAYGASEVGGVAQMCPEGGLHVSVDHVVVEVIRPDGSVATDGETGELALTTLNNFGMPLIRFRVGDIGAKGAEPCVCGLPFPTMTLVSGKAVDLISTSERQAVSAHFLDYVNIYLMKHGIRGVKQFLVEQTATDSFRLTLVRERVFDDRAPDVFAEKMREYLGQGISVETCYVDDIPLQASGKRRYFKKMF